VIVGATLVTLLNIQVLQSFSLYLSGLRQSGAVIPLLNWHWSSLSNQLDPSKYQRLIFGLLLVIMMIYRPAGLLPAARRKRELNESSGDAEPEAKGAERV
jgi:branched-chain amino acid transport system permease protein